MKVLLLGSGGRESALAEKLSKSPQLTNLFIAPGNGGTWSYGTNVRLHLDNFNEIAEYCIENKIDCLVCGPEQPAVDGIWDYFQHEKYRHILVIAPSKEGARLEGEKSFAKKFMQKCNIPTADYIEVWNENLSDAHDWFNAKKPPYVIKADGLAAGKGVVLPESKEEAHQHLNDFVLDKKFGDSSAKIVLEDFIQGIEFSVFVYTNGKQYTILPNAKDYKRRFEGDKGLNTGGMGCISPVPFVTPEIMKKVENEIIRPTIDGLQNYQIAYNGFIYFGLILSGEDVYVIEYNARLGDPETEVILPRMGADLLELFQAGAENKLDGFDSKISDEVAVTVIAVADGYPEEYEKGKQIVGLENVTLSTIYHAGTKLDDHKLVTNGGRVLAVTSMARNLSEALKKSYNSLSRIKFEGMQYRTDIGYEFLENG